MEIIVSIIPTDLVTNSFLSSFCPFLQIKNKNFVFSKLVVQLYFCFLFKASRSLLQSHPNSTDFYKGVFSYVIPIRIIVSWLNLIISEFHAKRWPKCTCFKLENDVVQNLIDGIFSNFGCLVYFSTGDFLQCIYSVLGANNHQKFRLRCLVDDFSNSYII